MNQTRGWLSRDRTVFQLWAALASYCPGEAQGLCVSVPRCSCTDCLYHPVVESKLHRTPAEKTASIRAHRFNTRSFDSINMPLQGLTACWRAWWRSTRRAWQVGLRGEEVNQRYGRQVRQLDIFMDWPFDLNSAPFLRDNGTRCLAVRRCGAEQSERSKTERGHACGRLTATPEVQAANTSVHGAVFHAASASPDLPSTLSQHAHELVDTHATTRRSRAPQARREKATSALGNDMDTLRHRISRMAARGQNDTARS